ncbi:MAG TPA: (Fe-S)-binding protein [Gemmatimonadales bacterium]|nr:(Fe-S)-binding protein [Gemmatimonadales bacterium]
MTQLDPLAPCVHCGFCLPACPTYLATGDESDSPRGRIVLMRALALGELGPRDDALAEHLDACLGCRGCEPVCPSGVQYGRGLEIARARLAEARGLTPMARVVLGVFRRSWLWRPIFTVTRWLRATGVFGAVAGGGRVGFAAGMVEATRHREERSDEAIGWRDDPIASSAAPRPPRNDAPRKVLLFRGCVMDTLFTHVHDATRRTLEINGYEVVEAGGQVCCGALHDHAGDVDAAKALAAENIRALAGRADFIVVDSAGCGALLKDYGHLLGTEAAAAFGAKVRDVSELLAAAGPVPPGPLDLDVVYDAPCHLQHAQGVHAEPLKVLGAIPGLRLRVLPGSDKCCGSAGIYSLLRPDMARAVLDMKIEELATTVPRPACVTTGNPGCLMQIGAGLRAAGLPIRVVHPVELLDWAYSRLE